MITGWVPHSELMSERDLHHVLSDEVLRGGGPK